MLKLGGKPEESIIGEKKKSLINCEIKTSCTDRNDTSSMHFLCRCTEGNGKYCCREKKFCSI